MADTCAVDKAWADAVAAVFPGEYSRMYAAVCKHPAPEELAKLLLDLAGAQAAAPQSQSQPVSQSKKRKFESNGHANGAIAVSFECQDVSFQVPARKKLKLQLVANAEQKELRLLHPSNQVEYAISADQIDEVFCLPVPEKQQRQCNFCLFPRPGAEAGDGVATEQVVFTMNETAPTGATNAVGQAWSGEDTYVSVTEAEMNAALHVYGKRVIRPSDAEFASSIVQSHRKTEKAYHVKAHRGSKEGYLFFTSAGIVYGFKKPLAFFPFSTISAVSYTSVLQRTFNLVIATSADGADIKEHEFSMLDQADFAGIDGYVKRHGLNDASMAAERRAKVHNVNKVKKEDGVMAGEGLEEKEDGMTELQRAEMDLQDEEDEEEEDFEPSGGESEGEGGSSEEDFGDGADDEDDEEMEGDEQDDED